MGKIIVQHEQIISASGKDVESNGTTYRDSRVVSFALRRLLWRHQNIVVIVGARRLFLLAFRGLRDAQVCICVAS